MNKKNIVSKPENGLVHKLKAFIKKSKEIRRKFTAEEEKFNAKAKKLAGISENRANIRREFTAEEEKLSPKAKKLAGISENRANIRREFTAEEGEAILKNNELATTAREEEKEKKIIRGRLSGTEKKLTANVERLATTAKEKEEVRLELAETARKLAATAKEKEEVRRELAIRIRDLENANLANRNILEDLQDEREVLTLARNKDEAILASIGDGMVAVDKNGKIIEFNEQFRKLLVVPVTARIKGAHYADLWQMQYENGTTVPFEKRPIEVALSGKSTSSGVYYYERADKTRFPASITASPMFVGKAITGVVAIFRDITREMAADKAKSEFVSVASHQLRTPLGITKWYLEALGEESYIKKSPSIIRNYFDEISKSNERVLSLVRNLLSVSRIDENRVKDVPKPVNLIDIAKNAISQLQVVADKKRITLKLIVQDVKIPTIEIDMLRLNEVVENLIVNAVEYSSTGDTVDVTVGKEGGSLLLSVKDTGIGMSETDQKNIFTKFYRSEEAVRHNPEGSGLGLYVVKSYVEGWGGKISFKSTEGVGSTFTISLPIKIKKNIWYT